jgi:hypothetical protein
MNRVALSLGCALAMAMADEACAVRNGWIMKVMTYGGDLVEIS